VHLVPAVSVLLMLTALMAPAASRAAPGAPLPERRLARMVDEAVAQGVPGLQVHVSRGGRDWSRASGFASIETRRPMARTTRLRTASITKLMTYAVTMELVRQGRLKLTDRAVDRLDPRVLAGVPHAERITIAQLLDHQSGLHNFNGPDGQGFFRDLFADPARGDRIRTAQELIDYAKLPANRPDGLPGAGTWYSSTGYMVLELILERATGRPIHRLYRDLLFRPLAMTSAGMEGPELSTADIADSYAVRAVDADGVPSPFDGRAPIRRDGLYNLSAGLRWYNGWARAAGAVALSADDLARFMAGVRAGRFTVFKDQAAALGRASPTTVYDWNGGTFGVQATVLYAPAPDITVVVIENGSGAGKSAHDLAREILALLKAA